MVLFLIEQINNFQTATFSEGQQVSGAQGLRHMLSVGARLEILMKKFNLILLNSGKI